MSTQRSPQAAPERKLRADAVRNRAGILEVAQRHFLAHGIGTSLEAIAKEAGVGAGTLYRHFPTREALLAALLQRRTEEVVASRDRIGQVGDPGEALREWMRAMEDYLSSYTGLPGPLAAAAQERDPDNPLTLPCEQLITATQEYLHAAQQAGVAHAWVRPRDLFLTAVSIAWVRGAGAADDDSIAALRRLDESGYRPA
ncbi:TetR/AcrR family transcriptional regulator [Agilicoccus flavus]|uniref:TetR/AcrR family transcriptional regulator n=1 Tax=Agilicoccus flavus TaxID=2775968 RepID=UPI001CF620DF|nr:TetR/AcrR family transcriptional regulator [Agilicoccus flavus]